MSKGECKQVLLLQEEEETKSPSKSTRAAVEDSKDLEGTVGAFLLPVNGTNFEVSVHPLPRALKRDIAKVFFQPLQNGEANLDDLKIIPTVQHTKMSILMVSDETAKEKDDCLETFARFANEFRSFLLSHGAWADFCDPCSGLPMYSDGNVVYSEIQGLEKLRRFPTTNAGSCRVAMHPVWGANMYPATMFACASKELILKALEHCQHK